MVYTPLNEHLSVTRKSALDALLETAETHFSFGVVASAYGEIFIEEQIRNCENGITMPGKPIE